MRCAPTEVISAAAAGDRDAVDRLVAVIWPVCFRLAASIIGDMSLAQDAAQEACAIVYASVRHLRNAEAFDVWLYRIVMREAARVRRKNVRREMPAYDFDGRADTAASLDIWRALARLPADLRDVTVLFYFDDLKSVEIAAVLRIPHATVRTRLARARERLRPLLDDREDDPAVRLEQKERHAY